MSPRNFKFADKSNWSLINRGQIFEAVVPYVGERPLEFFIPDRTSPHKLVIKVQWRDSVNKDGSFLSWDEAPITSLT